MTRRRRLAGPARTVALLVLLLPGCLQIETRIQLHEDGSATVTERVQFSRQLLDLSRNSGPDLDVAPLLTKEAALTRIKQMGKDVMLVSHEVRDGEQGSRESLTVFKIADINEFRYVSPYLAALDYPKHNTIKCSMFPTYESTWYGRVAGQVAVTFAPETSARPRGTKEEPPKGAAPVDLQPLRDLMPVFRDLMTDFRVRITFESYAPLRFRHYYGYRGSQAGTRTYDLIDFSDKNLDRFGGDFLGNEEIMVELLRLQTGGPNIIENVKEHAGNLTLPVYHPSGTPEIYFRPSRAFFDKHFAGKMLNFGERHGGSRPANFDEIGHRSEKKAEK